MKDLLDRLQRINNGFGKYLQLLNKAKLEAETSDETIENTALVQQRKRQAAQSGIQKYI